MDVCINVIIFWSFNPPVAAPVAHHDDIVRAVGTLISSQDRSFTAAFCGYHTLVRDVCHFTDTTCEFRLTGDIPRCSIWVVRDDDKLLLHTRHREFSRIRYNL